MNGYDQILSQYKPCGKKGCIRPGKWVPIIVVDMVGRTEHEAPVKCRIGMFLCDKDKLSLVPADVLTIQGRDTLEKGVKQKYGKALNWDTVRVEWESDKELTRRIKELIKPK